jgi:spore maturation protein CgeB
MPSRPLKIIIPGSIYADNFAENVAFTLEQMGHRVITRPPMSPQRYSSPLRRYYRLFREKVNPNDYISPEEKWLLETARQERPDLLLTLTQSISEATLFELKKLGVLYCVAWWGDAPAMMTRMGLLNKHWDAIFLKDQDAVTKFRRVGLNAHLLHEAMNPAWHKPLAGNANSDVVVAGVFYGYRQFLVRRLIEDKVAVGLYGPALPRWVYPEIKAIYTNKYLVKEEKSRVFGQALACLNSTAIAEGNSLNCRAFEVAGAGGLQIMEHRPVIGECFEPGKELLVYNSYEELLDYIHQAQKFPEEMKSIREAGAKRALAEHTYRHRLEKILTYLEV